MMVRVAIHQPNYMPGLRYFDKMADADIFVLLDNVAYSKNNWTNRNRIWNQDRAAWLTVPVRHAFSAAITEVQVADDLRWRRKHLRTLQQAYAHARYGAAALDTVRAGIELQTPYLAEINTRLIEDIASYLGFGCRLVRSSHLHCAGSGTDLLVRLCGAVGGDEYLSGVGGLEYLEVASFEKAGIRVRWQRYEHPRYREVAGAPLTELSIFDLIARAGPEAPVIVRSGERYA